MKKKLSLDEQLNEIMQLFDFESMCDLMKCLAELFKIYNVDDEDDWIEKLVGKDNLQNVVRVRTVYILSKIADTHASKFSTCKIRFGGVWKQLEKIQKEVGKCQT